jgi:hypothetical protein
MVPIGKRVNLAVVALALYSTAHATTLSTPAVDSFNGENCDCIVTNTNSKPLAVTSVGIFNFLGASVITHDECTGVTLAPNKSCEFESLGGGTTYCTATAKGPFRLMLNSTDSVTNRTLATAPGTK